MKEWLNGLSDEIAFWDQWFAKKGLDWPEDYKFRIDPNTEIQPHIAQYIKTGRERILDCGSGPLTVLGKNYNGIPLQITACDALALEYEKLYQKYEDIDEPIVYPFKCEMEKLDEYLDDNEFHIVYAQNCVDHSYSPVTAIEQMLKVCKLGGVVLLYHETNEGENEHYKGLHQWNFTKENNDFIIWNKTSRINITHYLHSKADVNCHVKDGFITVEIIKNENSKTHPSL